MPTSRAGSVFLIMTIFYWFILSVLSVWRITHLLSAEDGPFKCISRLRQFVGSPLWQSPGPQVGLGARVRAVLGELMDCFNCLSLWIAAPFALLLGSGWKETLLLWPALSGAAILLERATGPGAPAYLEDPVEKLMEVRYELLRKDENASGKKR